MKPWRLSPFVRVCLWLSIAALILPAFAPAAWPAALLMFVLVQLLLTLAGMLPRLSLLGRNLNRLPPAAAARGQVALTFDDGPDPAVTPLLLALLARHGVRATFFCIGERAARYPDLCRQIAAAGHQVENHGQRHRTLTAFCGPAGWRREILDGQATIAGLTGRKPLLYRPIAGLRNPFLDPVLQCHGLILASWTRRGYDTREPDPDSVLARLTRGLSAGAILLLHDGNAARTAAGVPVLLEVLPRLLQELSARRLQPVTLDQALGAAPVAAVPSNHPR